MDSLKREYHLNDDVIMLIAARLSYGDINNDPLLKRLTQYPRFWEEKMYAEFNMNETERTDVERMYQTGAADAYLIAASTHQVLYPGVELYLSINGISKLIAICDDFDTIQYFYDKLSLDNQRFIMEQLIENGKLHFVDKLGNPFIKNSTLIETRLYIAARKGNIDEVISMLGKKSVTRVKLTQVLHVAILHDQFNLVKILMGKYRKQISCPTWMEVSKSGNLRMMRYFFPDESYWVRDVNLEWSATAINNSLMDYLMGKIPPNTITPHLANILIDAAITKSHRIFETIDKYWNNLSDGDKYPLLSKLLEHSDLSLAMEIINTYFAATLSAIYFKNLLTYRPAIVVNFTGKNFPQFIKLLSMIPPGGRDVDFYNQLLYAAAGYDAVDIVIYALQNGSNYPLQQLMMGAKINILKYLHENHGIVINRDIVATYISNNDSNRIKLEDLIYLLNNSDGSVDIVNIMSLTIGHTETLISIWIFINYSLQQYANKFLITAVESGDISLTLYLIQKGFVSREEADQIIKTHDIYNFSHKIYKYLNTTIDD